MNVLVGQELCYFSGLINPYSLLHCWHLASSFSYAFHCYPSGLCRLVFSNACVQPKSRRAVMPNELPDIVLCRQERALPPGRRKGYQRQFHSHICPGIEISCAHGRKGEIGFCHFKQNAFQRIYQLVLDWPQSRELGQSYFWCLDTSLALFLPHPFRSLCTHGFSVAQKMVSQIGKILFFAWPDKLLQG